MSRSKKMILRGIPAAMVLAVATGAGVALAENENPTVFPPASSPYGVSYNGWSALLAQTILGTAVEDYPTACTLGSIGRVQLLQVSTGAPLVRSCTLPAASSILFPVFTSVEVCPFAGPICDPDATVEELAAIVMATVDLIDPAVDILVEVDGSPLQDFASYRFLSPAFPLDIVEGNIFGAPPGHFEPAVGDGYWIMLTPLPPGDHVIHIFARLGGLGEPAPEFDTTVFVSIAPE